MYSQCNNYCDFISNNTSHRINLKNSALDRYTGANCVNNRSPLA